MQNPESTPAVLDEQEPSPLVYLDVDRVGFKEANNEHVNEDWTNGEGTVRKGV